MRKNILIVLAAFISSVANAQKFELSIKGGLLGNNIKEAEWGRCMGVTGLVTVGYLRVGVSISSYSYTYYEYSFNGRTGGDMTVKVGPYIPVEAVVLNRFGEGPFSIDFGITGGICQSTRIKREGVIYGQSGAEYVSASYRAGALGIGGFVAALQYGVTKKLLVGIEAQAKKQFGHEPASLFPVMIKLGVKL